jgi:uncharacterized RDD family membrane protein YckC
MSSAQLDIQPLDEGFGGTEAASAPFVLKAQVAERLAAHRARRAQPSGTATAPATTASPAKARSARIAAAVAERYAQSQSYREFLAAEAERAIRQAEAAAEVAALSARAVVEAQNQLLFELDQISVEAPVPGPVAVGVAEGEVAPPVESAAMVPAAPVVQAPGGGFTVRMYEAVRPSVAEVLAAARPVPMQEPRRELLDEEERLALDEEIAFRQSPVFEEPGGPPVELPANLIEFPRQLVAARRARPRLAEGPLREDADVAADAAQLRIFEVEATQISTAPVVESSAPEWSSIMLGALPASPVVETPEAQFGPMLRPQTAPLSLRLMAGIVDGCIVMAGLLAFVAAFAFTVGQLPHGAVTPQIAASGLAGTLVIFWLLYQVLFFTLSEATPGMRYARIGLCTFSDDNPTRTAMRRRIFAVLLSACPLGIGFLWACLDEDGLGWHDRISRMYQRSY